MMVSLGFEVAKPTVYHFLEKLRNANHSDAPHKELAQYLAELALIDLPMIRYAPSLLAAAAVLLSNKLLGRQPAWPATMAQRACHTEVALSGCAEELLALYSSAATNPLQAVRKKYL